MIVVTLDVDTRGRPIIELFVAASAPRLAALAVFGETPPSPIPVRALLDTDTSRLIIIANSLCGLCVFAVGNRTKKCRIPAKFRRSRPEEVDYYLPAEAGD